MQTSPYVTGILLNADLKLHLTEAISISCYDTAHIKYWYALTPDNQYHDFAYTPEDDYSFTNNLKQCYISFNIKEFLFFDIGRKVEKNGISFYKNPSDFMLYQGETDLSLSKDEQALLLKGNTLVKVELFATDKLFLSALYSPEIEQIDNDHQQIQGRLAYQFNNCDLDFIAYYNENMDYTLTQSTPVPLSSLPGALFLQVVLNMCPWQGGCRAHFLRSGTVFPRKGL